MKGLKDQSGVSMLGLLFGLLIIGFVALSGIKIFPVYMEYWSIKKTMTQTVDDLKTNSTSRQVRSVVQKKFDVNRVSSLNARDIAIERKKGTFFIDSSYEKRIPFISNIDVVLKFDQLKFEKTPK